MPDILNVEADAIPVIYAPKIKQIVIRHEFGMVIMFVDNRRVELTTIIAHKIGLVIARAIPKLEPNEMIVITINSERIELLPLVAQRASTALLRKADDADDWQIANRG
jgi:hypothetical protein